MPAATDKENATTSSSSSLTGGGPLESAILEPLPTLTKPTVPSPAVAEPILILAPPACQGHEITNHPEKPQRVAAILKALRQAPALVHPSLILDQETDVPRAARDALARFHTEAHLDGLFELFAESAAAQAEENKGRRASRSGKKTILAIDGDTAVMPKTEEAMLRSVGAACLAVDQVLGGKAQTAFCVIRPPGHHAGPKKSEGFCFVNNAGIAALHARATHGLTRIAVIDPDVHHGNGTQVKEKGRGRERRRL
jgi:acetoin utilization deacetylase AcuC-like enzyme